MMDMELLPWNSFFDSDERVAPAVKESTLRHINAFREIEWPNMKRELMKSSNWEVPDNLEPHWVESGRAIFWQKLVIRQPATHKNDEGVEYRVLEDVDYGWHPTSGLPVGNASQLQQYLEKGLRFRPPSGVDVEIVKSAVPSEAFEMILSEQEEEERPAEKYECRRHGYDPKVFYTWKTYIKHCDRFREEAEYQVPDYVMEMVADSKYYCFQHNKSFPTYRAAVQHVKDAQRQPGALKHAPATAMEVARFLKTDGQGG